MTVINSHRLADNCRRQMIKRGICATVIFEDEEGDLVAMTSGAKLWKLEGMMRGAISMVEESEVVDLDDETYGPAEPGDG